MTLPVLTALAIIFILWINYEIHKNSKHVKDDAENFWKRENASNLIRRADISSLDYIIISTEQLPMDDNCDQTINSYRDKILSLSGKKAINLGNLTNTELKLKYGTANLNPLTEYDNNYSILVSILQKWAERLYHIGSDQEAIMVLEYAVLCDTDVANTYLLLAKLYHLGNCPDKTEFLIAKVQDIAILDKDKLILELTKIMNI